RPRRLRLECGEEIALPQLVARVDDDGVRDVFARGDDLNQAGGVLAGDDRTSCVGGAEQASNDDVLSGLEPAEPPAIDDEFIVSCLALARCFTTSPDRAERLWCRAWLRWPAHRIAVVDRHRRHDWRGRPF